MRKEETLTIEMTKTEAKKINDMLGEAIIRFEALQEALDDLFDVAAPIVYFADAEEAPMDKLFKEAGSDEPDCENCNLPCVHNPNFAAPEEDTDKAEKKMEEAAGISHVESKEDPEKDEDPEDEDEAESLAIELLKAVFAALTDVIENGE